MATSRSSSWPLYSNRHISLLSTEAVNSKPHCRFLILSAGKTQTG